MSYAQLEIEYTKVTFSGPPVSYLVQTKINPVVSEPDEIDNSLVVYRGSALIDEYIARVATRAEIITSPLPALPPLVDRFASTDFGLVTLLNGDIITVEDPSPIWQQFFGITGDFVTTIVDAVTDPLNVVVDPPLPAFGRDLKFYVKRGATWILPTVFNDPYPINGVANRDYSAFLPGDLNFLAAEHHDAWEDLSLANAAVDSLRTEAQSLVDELNLDNFSGVIEELYE